MRIDHIAIAVRSIDEALATYRELWGLEAERVERVESDGIVEAMLPIGDAYIQLLESTRPDSTVAKFIERRGEGLHHIGVAVADLGGTLADLRGKGAGLIDEAPRPGGGGHMVAFVHPMTTTGVLIELIDGQAHAADLPAEMEKR